MDKNLKNYPLSLRLLGEHPGFCQDRRLDTFGLHTGERQTVVRLAGALVKQDGFAMTCSFRGPVCLEISLSLAFPGTFPPQCNKSKEQATERDVESRQEPSQLAFHPRGSAGGADLTIGATSQEKWKGRIGRIREHERFLHFKTSAWEMVLLSGFIFSHH